MERAVAARITEKFMTKQVAQGRAIEQIIAKDEIRTVLIRYAQAIDRSDLKLLKSVFWPDATDDHGVFSGNAWEFAEFIIPLLRQIPHTVQRITNVEVVFEKDGLARVQSYYLSRLESDSGVSVIGGRYLDRFAHRQGEWRILSRIVVMDWNQNSPSTSNWGEGAMYSQLAHGVRTSADPWYVWQNQNSADPTVK
jgi:SnoaL-like domain